MGLAKAVLGQGRRTPGTNCCHQDNTNISISFQTTGGEG